MEQNNKEIHSFYRIRSIEYTNDGRCMVGVQTADTPRPQQFKLSGYCYRPNWLKHFHQTDLDTIWQLAKQQATVSFVKRIATYLLIKTFIIKDTLRNWEEEAKHHLPGGIGQDFEDW